MEQSCRFCLCTDSRACKGGCSWIKPGYCSACYDLHMEQLIRAVTNWNGTPEDVKKFKLGNYRCRVVEDVRDGQPDSLVVLDHIQAVAFRFSDEGAYVAPQYDPLEIAEIFAPHAKAA